MTRGFAIVLTLLVGVTARAQVPAVYQGRAADAAGAPLDGPADLFFALYPAETGGTPVFTHSAPDVPMVRGWFSVDLPIDPALLAQDDLWLAVAIDAPGDELLPRQPLASMPWTLRCGDAARLGGVEAAAFQARVSDACPTGSFMSQVMADGSVDCEVDDSMGVTGITAGLGLVADVPNGNVTLDVNPGPGLQVVADALEAVYGGTGVSPAIARGDHGHPGVYLPQGATLSCPVDMKVTAIDATTGDVVCDIDVDTTYGAGPSGNLEILGGDTLTTATDITVGGTVDAAAFAFSTPKVGYASRHPADFDPVLSGDGDYVADADGPGTIQSGSDITVLAPLHLPQGATITQMDFSYRSNDDAEFLCCGVRVSNALVDPIDSYLEPADAADACTTNSGGSLQIRTAAIPLAAPFAGVDNANFVYQAECFFQDGGAFTGDLELVGYRVTYTYTDL